MLNYFAEKWRRQKNLSDIDMHNDLIKKLNYSTRDMSINFQFAKDLRLYNMEKPLFKRLEKVFEKNLDAVKKVEGRSIFVAIVSFLVILIRDAAAL